MKPFIATFSYIILLLTGQFLFKTGLNNMPHVFSLPTHQLLFRLAFSPHIAAGIFLYVFATVIWLYLLSRYELSYIYPFTSLSFLLALLVSVLFLGEVATWNRWLGVVVIIIGVYLVSLR